jgi:acyl carrier protein
MQEKSFDTPPAGKFYKKPLAKRGKRRYHMFVQATQLHLVKRRVIGMIFEKVAAILAEQLDAEAETITLESSLVDDLGADSLDVVDLVMTLEDEFDMEIPDEDIENVRTVGDIVKYLEEHTA